MKFSIENTALRIDAETPREAAEIVAHFRLDVVEHTGSIMRGDLSYLDTPGKRDNRSWFFVACTVGPEFVAPYMAKLQAVTGYSGPIPTLSNAPKYPGSGSSVNLCHTHIVTVAELTPYGYAFQGFQCASDWNNRTARENAELYFSDYARENLGARKFEPEYIKARNNHLVRNPNYLKRHAPHPEMTSKTLWACLVQWWLETNATDAQREVYATSEATYKSVCRAPLSEALMRERDGFRVAWDKPLISFADFAGLK